MKCVCIKDYFHCGVLEFNRGGIYEGENRGRDWYFLDNSGEDHGIKKCDFEKHFLKIVPQIKPLSDKEAMVKISNVMSSLAQENVKCDDIRNIIKSWRG